MLPADTFVLVENAKHHLFIADGIGITVLSSLIQELYKQGKSNSAKLIHCVPSESQATFANHYQSFYLPNRNEERAKAILQWLNNQTERNIVVISYNLMLKALFQLHNQLIDMKNDEITMLEFFIQLQIGEQIKN
ncbi:unnamed protein product [Rotaria sordida]|uniref:Ferric reductase NAD binding domain-containing protein n=1 Tax=Rotaria sordida TaxID=392033 RepID=A0A816B9V7_9BILA|nr:unnamed protein product [Rotaria sordida]CAF1605573.1 unnamed protein product [Rotaria sordida]